MLTPLVDSVDLFTLIVLTWWSIVMLLVIVDGVRRLATWWWTRPLAALREGDWLGENGSRRQW